MNLPIVTNVPQPNLNDMISTNEHSFLHMNVQGLKDKCAVVETFLDNLSVAPSCLCICEHWLSCEEINQLRICDYVSVTAFCRTVHKRGGVAIFAHKNMRCIPLPVDTFSNEIDCEVVGVHLPELSLILISAYRSPKGNFENFVETILDVLLSVDTTRNNVMLTGDFNVHFGTDDPKAAVIMDALGEFDLTTKFCKPTRFGNCLDNIYTSLGDTVRYTVRDILFSDHSCVLAFCRIPMRARSDSLKTIRPVTSSGMYTFYNTVSESLHSLYDVEDVEIPEKFGYFIEALEKAANIAFPTKIVSREGTGPLEVSWFNDDLKELRNTLATYNELYKKTKNHDVLQERNKKRSEYKLAICNAKRKANDKFILDHRNNASIIWKIINAKRPTLTKSSDKDSDLNADIINMFLVGVADDLTGNIKTNTDPITTYMTGNSSGGSLGYFSFREVSQVEVRSVVDLLKSSRAMDVYGLNSFMIKKIKNLIIPKLTAMINQCIRDSVFPDALKIAIVTPVFKKGDINDPSNYRPISILPVISKIYEALLKNQMMDYFETNSLFAAEQFGFRSGRSTTLAVSRFVELVVECFESSSYCEASFLDLTKAFDCVSHAILIRKLYMYNFKPEACKLISSYLSSRRQCVKFNGNFSNYKSIKSGVPQGSILGPIIFLIYINDLPGAVGAFASVLYADDTTLITRGLTRDDALTSQAVALRAADDWFRSNQLSLNQDKSVRLAMSVRGGHGDAPCVKFLGMLVDAGLTWREHGEHLASRLRSAAFLLRRLSETCSPGVVRIAYFSLFHSHMNYGLLIWGHTATLKRIFALQRRAVRIVAGLRYREDCRDAFRHLKILTLPSLYVFECLKYMHCNIQLYRRNADVHRYSTRNVHDIHGARFRLDRSRNAFNYHGITFYNKLNEGIKNFTYRKFVDSVKAHLIDRALYSLQDFDGSF